MKLRLRNHTTFALSLLLLGSSACARGSASGGTGREDNFMVSNGQGISSPGFGEGISGQNPAGLINNQRIKIQMGAATFDNSTQNAQGSAALLMGNGFLAAGAEYSRYNAAPFARGTSLINGGLALRMSTLNMTLGVSGHLPQPQGAAQFDLGTLIDLAPALRFGAMVPNVTNGVHIVASGFTYSLDPSIDLVVDAAYGLGSGDGTVKPGMSIHTDLVQATFAYGLRMMGVNDVLLYPKLTGALGLKLTDNILVEYTYRGLPEHRLGLTLRFN
ncbi:MAG: hypothetical protein H7333_06600 [Bdellovibrionales bacterium]|nr:hypothetical protein [Oligoflexia bacterium]